MIPGGKMGYVDLVW